MKTVIIALLLALLAGIAAGDVPKTQRSEAAISRVAPQLSADLERKGLTFGAPVFLQITKVPAELNVFIETSTGEYEKFRSYPICGFSGGLGPKKRQGDRKSPEGFYAIRPAQMNPASSYHLSFNLGYPNAFDRSKGYTGDYLMVHGSCVSIGCYAMTDQGIEEIWAMMSAAFEAGQREIPVHIYPYRMNWLMRVIPPSHPDRAFWKQLEPAWQAFSTTKRPPRVTVSNGQYIVSAYRGE